MKTSILTFSPKGDTELILRRPNFRKRNEPKNESTANETAPENESTEDQPPVPDVYSDQSSLVHNIDDLKALNAFDENGHSVEIHLRVSSAHLTLSSPVFKAMLDGPFSEGMRNKDNLLEVKAFEWNAEALVILLDIIHRASQKSSTEVPRDCGNLCRPVDHGVWKGPLFTSMVAATLQHSKVPVHTDLPLPSMIVEKVEAQRLKLINDTLNNLYGLHESLWATNDDCKPQCASMLLGSLMKQMREAGLEIPKPKGLPSTIRSLVGPRKFVSGLETPVWYIGKGYGNPSKHECSFKDKTKPWMDDMAKTYKDGLRFEDFRGASNCKAILESD
ncbi:hypothetical protein FACUT_4946 [Fusarium acutatum]|uniref:BTB domain-containing protein n=1 Tax=Fusarium acutatum TaxID=78861 RepID=A0A8H4NMH4_9HYPO|nr:hypothetical protein FACUT_4946 [Fusarium acutatum]